ncbi:MAG: hypothetical protein ACLUEQ_03295 [Cloacibacillus evryensis]
MRGISVPAHVTLNRPVRAEVWALSRRMERRTFRLLHAHETGALHPDPRFVVGSNRVLTGFISWRTDAG